MFVERFFNDLKKKPSESEEKKIQLPLKSRRVFEDSPDEGALFAPVPHSSGAEQVKIFIYLFIIMWEVNLIFPSSRLPARPATWVTCQSTATNW